MALHFSRFFLKSEYLHYGLFKNGLKTDISNLKKAQEKYEAFLTAHMPETVKTILDVGSGSGKTALTLCNKGFQVECVSPSILLNNYARSLLDNRVPVFDSDFESFTAPQKYDLILFSESLQYLQLEKSLSNALTLLSDGGYIMVADFFKTDAPGKSRIGGGHRYAEWVGLLKRYPLEVIEEVDITEQTAPTLDLSEELTMTVAKPAWENIVVYLETNYPKAAKFLKWQFRKKIEKIENKYLKGGRNAEEFKTHKKYIFCLIRKK